MKHGMSYDLSSNKYEMKWKLYYEPKNTVHNSKVKYSGYQDVTSRGQVVIKNVNLRITEIVILSRDDSLLPEY